MWSNYTIRWICFKPVINCQNLEKSRDRMNWKIPVLSLYHFSIFFASVRGGRMKNFSCTIALFHHILWRLIFFMWKVWRVCCWFVCGKTDGVFMWEVYKLQSYRGDGWRRVGIGEAGRMTRQTNKEEKGLYKCALEW